MSLSRSKTFNLEGLALRIGGKAATATAGAATLHANSGTITTESLTTAAAAEYVLTLTNANARVGDHFIVTAGLGSSTAGVPGVTSASCTTDGTVVINITNVHASNAFNGTLRIGFIRVTTR